MSETGDLGNHILTVAIIVFYWALLGNWVWPPPSPGGDKSKHADTPVAGRMAETSSSPAASPSSDAIGEIDRDFDAGAFLTGAVKAYETVLQAYADSDIESLRGFVDPQVFDTFERAIAERRDRNETLQLTIVGMHEATIAGTMRKGGMEEIDVRFAADVVNVTRSADDAVVAGDPQRIVQVRDAWTFARNTVSRNPNWSLVATDAWE